ncbi:MAG: maltose alpha-D-glucosyltransferase [Planctomycetota bacterium]|nr:MAG: maltose alpha-D-glucosyltransferase [Planctomycetota bacterium]
MKRKATKSKKKSRNLALTGEPQWYKDAVIYQLHVRSFMDSDGDGIGDFRGLTKKLDYLQDLGVTALWLLPFYPSPLKDDGYDIAGYTDVRDSYGTLGDFKTFVREAHARGLRVITELVINHTSDQHPWFQRARHAKPGSPERDYYVWSDTPEKYQDARIIFKDFEVSNWAWDPIAKAYYWHRFYSHQPDLNFDNPRVQRSVFEVLDYWLELGVDGLRLDAVPYLYEREGTNCENLPETHAFLKALRSHVDKQYPDRMLLAEANQWPEDAIAYFGDGDECHTAFHFPVMPRLFMAIHMEDRFPIVDIMQQTPEIPEDCQWLIFLRNHDELTLEMVTDEERDYMYRVYARDHQARINLGIRRRLAPLLSNNRRKIELMNGLLCALPGTPVIYYGDEIGMGDNIYLGDRHGVRTPMQWSPDRNAGFSDANPQRLYSPVIIDSEYLFESVNVETQQQNPHSLLWWMKRVIALRQNFIALRRGTMEILSPENTKILAFTRDYEDQSVLMVANLSRFVQFVELDLSRFAGRRPVEMFGQAHFPVISKSPYILTLGPHAFYWFSLEHEAIEAAVADDTDSPRLTVSTGWKELTRDRPKRQFEKMLHGELTGQGWIRADARQVQGVKIYDAIALGKGQGGPPAGLFVLDVDYIEGEEETFLLPLGVAWGHEQIEWAITTASPPLVVPIQRGTSKEAGILFDASHDRSAAAALVELMVRRRRYKGTHGDLVGWSTPHLEDLIAESLDLATAPMRAEHRDNSIVIGDKLVLKLVRRAQAGTHPDLEIGRFLGNGKGRFPGTLKVLGAVEYRPRGDDPLTVGVLHEYVPNTVTAWQYVQDGLGRFFEHVMTLPVDERPQPSTGWSLWEMARGDVSLEAQELLGGFLEWSAALGSRTADLHVALTSRVNGDFTPEPFTQLYQRSLYQSARKLALKAFQQLRAKLKSMPEDLYEPAQQALAQEKVVLEKFRTVVGQKISSHRIRCHGDYHLGHVLYTGRDFLVVDFEGDPGASFASRRVKRGALADVASMIYSLRSATLQKLQLPMTGIETPEAAESWRQAADFWYQWNAAALLRAYVANPGVAVLVPPAGFQLNQLLEFYLLEEAIEQLQHDLAHDAFEFTAVPLGHIAGVVAE